MWSSGVTARSQPAVWWCWQACKAWCGDTYCQLVRTTYFGVFKFRNIVTARNFEVSGNLGCSESVMTVIWHEIRTTALRNYQFSRFAGCCMKRGKHLKGRPRVNCRSQSVGCTSLADVHVTIEEVFTVCAMLIKKSVNVSWEDARFFFSDHKYSWRSQLGLLFHVSWSLFVATDILTVQP
jgi:hypothetical protein